MFTSSPQLIVKHPQQLTKSWAQTVLAIHSPNITVSEVNLISVDIGTTSRIQLEVNHDGANDLPRRWFVKMPSLAWQARAITALPRLLATEVYFYQNIADQVPLNTPQLLMAASHFGVGSTLVLGDIAENGAQAGKTGQALSAEQAYAIIGKLAEFHSQFWNQSQQNQTYQKLAGPIRQLENILGSLFAVPLMKRGLKKAQMAVGKELHQPAIAYARQRKRIMNLLNQGPQTLIHRDCHPGNFFWKDNQPGFLDWQLVRFGEGIADVAYFLATALAPDTRRRHEKALIEHYSQSLNQRGINEVNFETLWQRYQIHLCYPLEAMLVTLAVGGMMELQSNLTMIRRAAEAVADHQVFKLLPLD